MCEKATKKEFRRIRKTKEGKSVMDRAKGNEEAAIKQH